MESSAPTELGEKIAKGKYMLTRRELGRKLTSGVANIVECEQVLLEGTGIDEILDERRLSSLR